MSQIRGKDTKPEVLVRSILHRNGYRFRLHVSSLPGKPDIVLPKHNKIIEVFGCYWHMHDCKYGRVVPKTNTEFWQEKRRATVERDKKNLSELESSGWGVKVVWECECRDHMKLENSLLDYLK